MYATLTTMAAQFGVRDLTEITDTDEPYSGQINEVKLQAAMDAANSEVDGYLASMYAVPVNPAPPFLLKLANDIARYHVITGNGRVSERDEQRYKAATDTLTRISKGIITLGPAQTGSAPPPTLTDNVVIKSGHHHSRFGGGSDWGRGGY